jgi:hypothetical protein
MTYSTGSLIVPADFNGFIATNTYYLNKLWASGSGTYGYGQTAISQVNVGDTVTATGYWKSLIDGINNMASHQGISLSTSLSTVNSGDLIKIINAIDAGIQQCEPNRLNAASSGSTSTSQTSVGAWSSYAEFNCTVTFGSADQARWFFNAGGQLGVSANHPTGGNVIDNLLNDICAKIGTIWFSCQAVTIGGTYYTPNMKVGGGTGPSDSQDTSIGYTNVGGSTRILHQTSSTFGDSTKQSWSGGWYGANYQPGTYADLYVSGGGQSISFRLIIDEVPDGYSTSGTTMYLTVRPPSTSYLSASWGSPSVSFSTATA